ncbi:MAG: DUF2232 domain-containing protein [Leptolyngbyaceae cyanobacterium bins.302]|nr:DUF2232 domain-containing protein [Leptolyngbyaceae cyanobacterium bins.302]
MNNSPPEDSPQQNATPAKPHQPIRKPDFEAQWDEVEQELTLPMSPDSVSTKPSAEAPEVFDQVSSTVRSLDASSPLIMVETAFLASAASLVWLVNFYFPFPLLRIFFPIPISLIYLRWGSRAAWMGALVAGLLLSVLMGPPRSLLYIMPFGIMGVLLGMLWRRRASWGIAIALGSILGAFGFFFRVWLVSLLLGDDLWLYSTTQVTKLIDWVCLRLGILFQPSLSFVQGLAIVLVVLSNIVFLFVVHLVAWFLFDRLRNPIPRPPKWVQVLMEYEE